MVTCNILTKYGVGARATRSLPSKLLSAGPNRPIKWQIFLVTQQEH